jgi:MarR family transcriptional regulator, temperature-dependent positive regulator of motility
MSSPEDLIGDIISTVPSVPLNAQLPAIRAWLRLDQAFSAFNSHLRERHGVTGAQLAMLRIVAERPVTLADLRASLAMHPATLGQLIDRLARQGLVERRPSTADRRKRMVEPTDAGRRLLVEAPLAGPIRLRHVAVDPDRIQRLAAAFEDAIELFGLKEWS